MIVSKIMGLLKKFFSKFSSPAPENDKSQSKNRLDSDPETSGQSLRFDLVNPEVEPWINSEADDYIRKIQANINPLVIERIKAGILNNEPPRLISKSILSDVSLTDDENRAVDAFRSLLLEIRSRMEKSGSANIEIGDLSEIEQGEVKKTRPRKRKYTAADFADGEIEKNVTRYREIKLKERADLLARTVTIKSSSSGQNALWQRFVEKGYLDKSEWEVGWIISPDERLCPICKARKGMRREIDGNYPDGTGTPPIHLGCRCGEGLYKRGKK